jgi:hypothetical protein
VLPNRYSALDDEIYIGGIYVRIFLQQPQYTLRRPEKFIEGLLEQHEKLAVAEGMAKDLGAIATGERCDDGFCKSKPEMFVLTDIAWRCNACLQRS